VEEFLTCRLPRSQKSHPAVPIALRLFGPTGTGALVKDVARDVGICERRFRRVFAAHVGLPPKLFNRILRFQRARAVANQTGKLDWAQLASSCGYFDQSYLINNFQEFCGLSPSEYLRQYQPDGRLKDNHVAFPE
jgi:transcriptional regulator GlxA family with amidase domain